MTQTGEIYRRNRRDLGLTKEEFISINPNTEAIEPQQEPTVEANIEPLQDATGLCTTTTDDNQIRTNSETIVSPR